MLALPLLRQVLAAVLIAAVLGLPVAARGDDAAAAIRERLEQWTRDFNAGKKDAVCDLFSRQAISEFRGQPPRRYDEICALLKRSLDDPAKTYRYKLDIREILVMGDVAVVRLTWTLHISPLDVTSVEPGLDVFAKEPDGKWRIVRYMAYDAP